MSTHHSSIDLTPAQLRAVADQIARNARRSGVSQEDIARVLDPSVEEGTVFGETIAADLDGENALEMAQRLGIVGCLKDGPDDLSSNPKHMEGFGRDDPDADSR